MAKVVDYYLTLQSPYAYLGHARLLAMAQQYGAEIRLKPCDYGRIFAASGGVPLAKRAPQRQAYRLVELQRWSQALDVPLNLHPAFFPVVPDTAARLVIASQLTHGTVRALELAGRVMQAVWRNEQNIADASTLQSLAEAEYMDGVALLKASEASAVQTTYQAYTDEAIAAGVFGAPWYQYQGQAFWGQDRLIFLEQALATT